MSPAESDPAWDRLVRDLGVALQRHRIALGMTQEELAHASGLTRSHYQQLEKGQSRPGVPANPSLRTLTQLSEALGVTLDALLGELRA